MCINITILVDIRWHVIYEYKDCSESSPYRPRLSQSINSPQNPVKHDD